MSGPDPNQNPFNITSDAYKGAKNELSTISDKAAKDYNGALKSIKELSQRGGFTQMTLMALAFEKLGPIIQPFVDFFSILDMGILEGLTPAIQAITEALFTEENIELMRTLGLEIGTLISEGVVPLTEELADLREEIGLNSEDVKALKEDYQELRKEYPLLTSNVTDAAFSLRLLRKAIKGTFGELEKLINLILELNAAVANFTLPNFIEGGGGGGTHDPGDDDDTWWNPFD